MKTRAIGAALGSGVSNFVTGYALSPVLYQKGRPPRPKGKSWLAHHYHWRDALGPALALSGGSLIGGAIKEQVQAAYEKRQEKKAGLAVALPSTLDPDQLTRLAAGGISTQPPMDTRHPEESLPLARQALISAGILETVKRADTKEAGLREMGAGFLRKGRLGMHRHGQKLERAVLRARRAPSAAEAMSLMNTALPSSIGVLRSAPFLLAGNALTGRPIRYLPGVKHAEASIGLMLYTRHPSEQPNEGKRRPIKGPAKLFGNRMNVHHVRREEKKGHQDEWMRQNAEYVDLGAKPGLAAVLQDVFGMREGVPVPRAQLVKALADKKKLQGDAVTRRRYAKLKGREDQGADSTHDTAQLAKDLELLIENPDVRYLELARR